MFLFWISLISAAVTAFEIMTPTLRNNSNKLFMNYFSKEFQLIWLFRKCMILNLNNKFKCYDGNKSQAKIIYHLTTFLWFHINSVGYIFKKCVVEIMQSTFILIWLVFLCFNLFLRFLGLLYIETLPPCATMYRSTISFIDLRKKNKNLIFYCCKMLNVFFTYRVQLEFLSNEKLV